MPLATGVKERPQLFGRPFDGPMEGHHPLMPRDLHHYDLHVWLWKDNPAGCQPDQPEREVPCGPIFVRGNGAEDRHALGDRGGHGPPLKRRGRPRRRASSIETVPPLQRLMFFGTPEIALPSLDALVESGRAPILVVSQPARPAGRGRRERQPPVAERAVGLGLPLAQPARVRAEAFVELVREQAPDIASSSRSGRSSRRSFSRRPPRAASTSTSPCCPGTAARLRCRRRSPRARR